MTEQTAPVRLSTSKPAYLKGDFSTLEPVNPNRQRISVFEGTMAFKDPSGSKNQYPPNSNFSVEPYPKIIIYGDPKKLYPQSSLMGDSIEITNQRAQENLNRPNQLFTSAFEFGKGMYVSGLNSPNSSTDARRPYGFASTVSQTDKQMFSNQNFTDSVDSQRHSVKDYKPPPSAPAG